MIVFAVLASAFSPPDPNFTYQFALQNPGVMGSPAGEDINVGPAWNLSTGWRVRIGIIGNGCTIVHRDIFNAQLSDLHYNVDDGSQAIDPSPDDPNPRYAINHAGIILGRSNEVCTVGVAFNAKFYCMKMTEKSGSNMRKALEKHKAETHIDYFAVPPRCKENKNSKVRRCDYYRYPDVDQAMIDIENTIVVSSSGADAVSGADAAMFAVAGNPRTITVSDTTAGGARTWWANRGASIVVNAPAGGSYLYGSSDGLLPKPPSIGDGEEKCEEMSPIGAGAAHVAGVIAMMLEARKGLGLGYRDLQAIFALTSTKNHPGHESWVKNARGFEYSDVYGFGRVNAELAVAAAMNWTKLQDLVRFPENISEVEIPVTRSGLLNRTVQVKNTTIKSIEWVELYFEFREVHELEVVLTSPSGTSAWIVKPGYAETTLDRMRFVSRHFFGEDPHGDWTVSFARNGVGHLRNVTEIEIQIFGAASDDYPVWQRKIGGDSTQKLPARDKTQLVVTRSSEECNTDITLEIKAPEAYNDEYTVSLRNDESHYVYRVATGVKPSRPVTFHVPCLTTQENMTLYAESRTNNISISTPFTIKNPNSVPQILSPAAYDTVWIHNGTLKLDLKLSMNWDSLSTDAPAQLAEVGLFDLLGDRLVHRVPVFYSNLTGIEFYVPSPLTQAVIYVKPLWAPHATGCNTLIQPVFVLREGDEEPIKFEVPLTDACPSPPGVNDGSFVGPNPKMRKIWIISVSTFAGLFMIIVLVWHCTCRRKSVDTAVIDMNSRPLLSRNED